jgi:Cu(I)/Ag(I) efflux system membrane protein CusA/SilA
MSVPTFPERVFADIQAAHSRLWQERVATLNWELHDVGMGILESSLIEAILSPDQAKLWAAKSPDPAAVSALVKQLSDSAKNVLLWRKTRLELVNEMNGDLQMPGWGNIWTQPIINRVNMLATGVRTQIGVKVFGPVGKPLDGPDGAIAQAQKVGEQIAARLKNVSGAADVQAEQAVGKRYVEVRIDRQKAARYGIAAADVADVVQTAMGGATATTVLEGTQRFAVQVRLAGDAWQDPEALSRIPIAANMMGDQTGGLVLIPLGMVADISATQGPSMIKSENGRLTNTVTLNVRGRDVIGFVDEAKAAIAPIEKQLAGTGQTVVWTGEFENQIHARQTLTVIFPITVLAIALLLWMTFRDIADVVLVLLAVMGALAGAVSFQGLFGFNFSLIVSIGYIAAFGMATQTGVIMIVYLREAVARRGGIDAITSIATLRRAVIDGAVHRLRPKLLTEGVAIVGLAPMLWAGGTGWQIMRPMAAPVLGGLLVSDEVIDLLIPVLFYWLRRRRWLKCHPTQPVPVEPVPQTDLVTA